MTQTTELTPERLARLQDIAGKISAYRNQVGDAVAEGIEEGANGRPVSEAEARGIDMLVSYLTSDMPTNELVGENLTWASRLARNCASDRLLTKVMGAWYMEGTATDWKELLDGPLGKAVDQAVETLRPFLELETE